MIKKISIRFCVSRLRAKCFALLLCMLAGVALSAEDIQKPVRWSVSARRISSGEAELLFSAAIEKSWVVYSVSVPEDGPLPIAVTLAESDSYRPAGTLAELSAPKEKHDEMFDMKVKYFSGTAKLSQRVALSGAAANPVAVSGTIEYQCCNDMQCVLLDDDFSVQVPAMPAAAATAATAATAEKPSVQAPGTQAGQEAGQAPEQASAQAFGRQPEPVAAAAAAPPGKAAGGGEQE